MCACLPAWRVLMAHISRKSKGNTKDSTFGHSTLATGSKALEASLGKGRKSSDVKTTQTGGGAAWMGDDGPTISTPRHSHRSYARSNGIGFRAFAGNASAGHGNGFYWNDDSIELIQQHPDGDDAREPEADSPPRPPPPPPPKN